MPYVIGIVIILLVVQTLLPPVLFIIVLITVWGQLAWVGARTRDRIDCRTSFAYLLISFCAGTFLMYKFPALGGYSRVFLYLTAGVVIGFLLKKANTSIGIYGD